MKKFCLILALIVISPSHGSFFEEQFDLKQERLLNQRLDKVMTNLASLSHMVEELEKKSPAITGFQDTLKIFMCHLAAQYASIFDYTLETAPTNALPTKMLGVRTGYSLSRHGRVDKSIFNRSFINQNRTRGFIYGSVKGVSLDHLHGHEYMLKLVLGSPDGKGESIYNGLVDLNKLGIADDELRFNNERHNTVSIDLTGSGGRRLSLWLADYVQGSQLSPNEFVGALEKLFRTKAKENKPIFEYVLDHQFTCKEKVFVSKEVPAGVYSLRYERPRPRMNINYNDGPTDLNEKIGLVTISSMNNVWSAPVFFESYELTLQHVNVGPGFRVNFFNDFDASSGGYEAIFSVAEVTEFALWAQTDWLKIESVSHFDFGRTDLQSLFRVVSNCTNEEAYNEVKKVLPQMLSKLEEMRLLISPRTAEFDISEESITPRSHYDVLSQTQSLPMVAKSYF
jgi:hypothetical protein